MRPLRERKQFLLALVVDPGVDQVLGEDATLEQEVVVGLQLAQGLVERTRKLRDALGFLGRQLVEVLVDRVVRLDLVLDPVEACLLYTSDAADE